MPENLPALLRARKLQRRVANRAPDAAEGSAGASLEAVDAARERLAGLAEGGADGGPEAPEDERREIERALGELLFAAVDVARRLHCDPELALRAASDRFRTSVEADA